MKWIDDVLTASERAFLYCDKLVDSSAAAAGEGSAGAWVLKSLIFPSRSWVEINNKTLCLSALLPFQAGWLMVTDESGVYNFSLDMMSLACYKSGHLLSWRLISTKSLVGNTGRITRVRQKEGNYKVKECLISDHTISMIKLPILNS